MRDFVSNRWIWPAASIVSMSILTWTFVRPIPAEVPGDLIGLMTLIVAVVLGTGAMRSMPRRIAVGAGRLPVPTRSRSGRR